jgi:hypothetical protein
MDPISITILGAIAATGADMLMKFLKPYVVTFMEGVRQKAGQMLLEQQQQRAGGRVRAITTPQITTPQILNEELNKRKESVLLSERRPGVSADDDANERLHLTMSASALKQHRIRSRADLADDVRIVSISGLGGRGKSSLLRNYLTHTNNNQG